MKKKFLSVLLCLCMVMALLPTTALAALTATNIQVTDATYYAGGTVKSVTTQFGWNQNAVKGRLVLMTERLRSAGEAGTNTTYGDFTNFGYYANNYNWSSFDDVVSHDISNNRVFGIISYTDEQQIENGSNNNYMTISFEESDIPLNEDNTYYVYFWTFYGGEYYPDNLILAFTVENGGLKYAVATDASNRNTLSDTYTEVISAATYSVNITAPEHVTKTSESGEAYQTNLNTAMTPVVYTADENYYFPNDYSVPTVNGIMVRRDSAAQITVYGTPSDNAEITLTAPTAKTKAAVPTGVTGVACTTSDNNDGKLLNVTAAMEYKKSDASGWTDCGGTEVTGLENGAYYVRVKATGTVLASDYVEVTVAAYTAVETYTVTVRNDGNGSGSAAPATAAAGTEITLSATANSGYHFKDWLVVSGDVTITDNKFIMPASDVIVKAIFEKNSGSSGGSGVSTYAITVSSAKNGDVTSSHKSAAKGTTVTLTVEPDKGYTLETLTVTDKNGDEIRVKEKNGKYTFTMPASKVYVEATFMEDNSMLNFFVDVPASAYYYDAVLWAADKEITGGVDDTHFAPNGICTRAQAVTFLWRAAGSPAPKNSMMSFTDVPAGSYYETAVLWAVENGITKGTGDTTFSPNATCTRGQIVSFLWRSQKSPASDSVNPFTDVAADAYYNTAVLWAAENGITGGTSATTFSPNNDCTRAQIVTFLYRWMVK